MILVDLDIFVDLKKKDVLYSDFCLMMEQERKKYGE